MKSVALIVVGLLVGSGCRPAAVEQAQILTAPTLSDGTASKASLQSEAADAKGIATRAAQLIRVSNDHYESASAGLRISIRADQCAALTPTFVECAEGAKITVAGVGRAKAFTFEVPTLQLNPESMLYRGALDGTYRASGTTLIAGDMDFDGLEDFALRTGNAGGYGSPSYNVYLQEAGGRGFVYSPDFSQLTEGSLGMFSALAGKIHVPRKSGCCEHWDDVYAVKGRRPVLTARIAAQE